MGSSNLFYPAKIGGDSFRFIYKIKDPKAFSQLLRDGLNKCNNGIKAEYHTSYIKSAEGKNKRKLMHAADFMMKKIQVKHA